MLTSAPAANGIAGGTIFSSASAGRCPTWERPPIDARVTKAASWDTECKFLARDQVRRIPLRLLEMERLEGVEPYQALFR